MTGFGIAPDRLVPFGVSYAAPVAPNTTAEGKSQNRRVELVKQGLAVRPVRGGIRITIRNEQDDERLLAALQ